MLADVKNFLMHPFSEDMTATEWAAFILFLMVVVAGWNIVLMHIFGDM